MGHARMQVEAVALLLLRMPTLCRAWAAAPAARAVLQVMKDMDVDNSGALDYEASGAGLPACLPAPAGAQYALC